MTGMYKSGICDTKPVISLKRSDLQSQSLRPVDWWQTWWLSV